ncbi:P-loop containing nucleoside triphosphate hydrolase protein [Mycena albidolilacea]|uniref:P-loop containing nucleoside triphosphate hydrolase protein n=1 Tax=Mycena albidolilacea TaxID=1033008 RepID=A0AAD7A9Z4_9AGAR|nr:P-loop containing nucleoside triphosphate hydrolase protein [Mycena albidolilacea]
MASSATLTTTHLPQLRTLLHKWNQSRPAPTGFQNAPLDKNTSKEVIVAFRTRPPLPEEATDKFQTHSDPKDASATQSVEFCAGITALSADPGVFVAHVPGMKWSGPTLAHKRYEADLGFGPDVENEEVYQRTVVAQDILTLALSGGVACILAYGQTGSGKTFTMESLEHRIARDLFDHARALGERLLLAQGRMVDASNAAGVFEISAIFLELMGKRASDLLEATETVDAQGNSLRAEVPIREDNAGNVQPRLMSTPVRSSAELETLIRKALSERRTAATLRNTAGSRSHAILTITTKNTLFPYANEGQLILMDLAGSERYEDSKDHDKQRMDEVRENNKGLMNLKECVCAKAKMASDDGFVHIPWRAHKLTMLLKPSKALVIAHVSPHIQDSVHSTNTLSYAAPFMTVPPKPRGPAPYDTEDPRTWTHAQTTVWLAAQFAAALHLCPVGFAPEPGIDLGVELSAVCPPGATAAHLGRLYTTEFVARCLAARTEALSEERLTDIALDVIGTLFHMLMVAKNRTRRAIMESRTRVTDMSLHTPQATARRAAQVAAARAQSQGRRFRLVI